MATWYVDPSAGGTIGALTVAAGDVIALRCGTVLREQINGAQIQQDRVRITQYGSGNNPVISGSDIETGWLFDSANGVWYVQFSGNIGGNVREDGVPLSMVAWAGTIAATAPTIPPGGFAIDPVGFRLYMRPSSGSPSGKQYEVSKRLYALNSAAAANSLVIEGVDVEGASRHGIVLTNRNGFVFRDGAVRFCGGYYETALSVRLGNGIELAAGCNDALVERAILTDIFDSAGTSQLYAGSSASISRHVWRDNTIARCRLAGIEVSTHTANQTISDVEVIGNLFDGMQSGWAGSVSNNAGVNLTNNGGASCSIKSVDVKKNRFVGCPKYAVLLNAGAQQSGVSISGNTMSSVGLRGVRTTGPAIVSANIIRNQQYGVEVVGSAAPSVGVFQNVLSGNERAIRGDAAGAIVSVRNNVIQNNLFSYSHSGVGTTLSASNNAVFGNGVSASYSSANDVTADPMLDPVTYRPLPGSPLIGAGVNVGPLLDKSGKRFARQPSIGAYEFVRSRSARV